MIGQELIAHAKHQPTASALRTAARTWNYAQLVAATMAAARELSIQGPGIAGVWCNGHLPLISTVAAQSLLGCDAVLFSASTSEAQVRQLASEMKLPVVVTDHQVSSFDHDGPRFQSAIQLGADFVDFAQSSDERPTRIILFTSGTSGQPKPAVHTWETMAAGINHDSKYRGRRWLSAYDPASFAGIQGWLQALLTGGCLCVPTSNDPTTVAELLLQERVEFAAATPSFWRLLLLGARRAELAKAEVVQITLGGEAVDQDLLDGLHVVFPQARITHIYASTEMGVCFSVRDGKAGFPAAYLSDRSLPCELRITSEAELEIRSNRAMLGYAPKASDRHFFEADRPGVAEWFATGDVVERRGDRVYFIGRKSETINVGGRKVYPADVERCIRAVPGVRQVRVFGVPSSITGQLVGAEVEPTADVDRTDLLRRILGVCRQHLARHQLPASVVFCEQLRLNASGKLSHAEALNGV